MTNLAIFNESTVLTDAQVSGIIPALQTQVSRDYLPAWGEDAKLVWVDLKAGQKPEPGDWWMGFFDTSDQAGALAYHDLTNLGQPIAKVFAGTDMQYGASWSVSASHELLEMLTDPVCALASFTDSGKIVSYEVADAVEDDRFGYDIDGVLLSDFCYPSWWETFWAQGATQFDYGRHVSKPLQLLPGGYIQEFGRHGWVMLTAEERNARARGPVGSRRERRRLPRDQWLRSAPKWAEK